jgi:hypothetical protein
MISLGIVLGVAVLSVLLGAVTWWVCAPGSGLSGPFELRGVDDGE